MSRINNRAAGYQLIDSLNFVKFYICVLTDTCGNKTKSK